MTDSLKARLANPDLLAAKAFIAGEWVDADNGKSIPVTNPSTGETISTIPDMGRAEAARAIDAAYLAQKQWAARTAEERSRIMRRLHDLMVSNQDDLAAILTAEMGKPLAEARGEVLYGAGYIQWFAEEARRIYGDVIPGHATDKRIVVIKQPVGVVGAITPWNFPNAMIARKLAPALAVGCAFVSKPAKQTPLSALALAVLAEQAGIPKGLFSVVTSNSSADIGAEFCENEKMRKLSFTGSTEVGRKLMAQCAPQIKKLSLELGGNAPFIVFGDADIDAAVEGAIQSKFRNAGQTCVCSNRLYIHSSIYDAFAEKLAKAVAGLSVGDGFADGVKVGPLIDEAAVEKVEEHIKNATASGAKIIEGGSRDDKGGTFFQPTVLTGVTQKMQVAKEETFGPLAPLFAFDTVGEVIEMANDTIFGLAAYFYARDLSRVWTVAEALEYGIVGVNTGLISTEIAPFGGVKQSGFGREGSKYGADDYLEMKYICMGGIGD
ncbi:NAD-dependent succinate-semialdehyde dehydrogenase [Mariluticola halotolerans]|uniref:NAD-dependent succinate-semialdehyde dehydrogenase n=1 Tax=Mariluticola halotolerans TaxID=2909283 RepID=UPI0026E1F2ED|nr:NAD-dependent succinate-semialdehyde dehydrogenase [Mariluticola halotolerans]